MFGSDIFVAPMLSSSNSMTIDFPAGNWTYLFNNSQVYSGPFNGITIPLNEFPVFIKSGSPLLQILDSVINSVTGIETAGVQNSSVRLYPNPAQDELQVSGLDIKANEEFTFQLFDMLSNNIVTTALRKAQTNISLKDVQNGIYTYRIVPANLSISKSITGKLVIQK